MVFNIIFNIRIPVTFVIFKPHRNITHVKHFGSIIWNFDRDLNTLRQFRYAPFLADLKKWKGINYDYADFFIKKK